MKKILVVDDEKTTVDYLKTLIESAGHECRSAENGEDALLQAETWRPDLVFMDVMLPEQDGFTLCARLKSNPKTKGIPVVVESALTDSASIQSAYQSGASDYLPKPFDRESLQRKLDRLLNVASPV